MPNVCYSITSAGTISAIKGQRLINCYLNSRMWNLLANINKRYRGCNPNPHVHQTVPETFNEFVAGFRNHSLKQGQADCQCGGISLCESTYLKSDRVTGHFVCRSCGLERDLSVRFVGLKQDYDKLVGEQDDM